MRLSLLIKALTILLVSFQLHATETRVIVRAKAKDAKFIGSGMGGMLICIRDAQTGRLLAEGLTEGGTGNTNRIMKEPKARASAFADEKTAQFEAKLDLDRPVFAEISAMGPQGQLQATAMASVRLWILPGKHIVKGDAILLDIPGFVVDIKEPPIHSLAGKAPTSVKVTANLVMMCGCPTEPGGLWDSSRYEMEAILIQNGKELGRFPMRFAGKTSQFEADLAVEKAGAYEVLVQVFDPETGNAGIDRTGFNLSGE